MSTDQKNLSQTAHQLQIAGMHIKKALQDVLRARLCVIQVSEFYSTSEPSDRIKSEERRVANILTTEVAAELAKALSILNSDTSGTIPE